MQTKKTAPFGIPNYTEQELLPITSLTKSNYKLSECSCALACQKQRSICFWLPFSLFLSFGQAKERNAIEICFKSKTYNIHPQMKPVYSRSTSPASGGQRSIHLIDEAKLMKAARRRFSICRSESSF